MTMTALFSRNQPGGVFTFQDMETHPGIVRFVDSSHAAASNALGGGRSPDAPFATLAYVMTNAASLTPALAAEIRARLASDPPHSGYRIPRLSHYLGAWVRWTDWYPDYQLRLYDRRRGQWEGRYVHESVQVKGEVGRLNSDLLHYTYRDVSHHLQTIDRYTSLAARQMFEDGRRAGVRHLLLNPVAAFLRNYIARGGFRGGRVGLIVSLLNSYYVLLKFVKLWELHQGTQSKG